jgi:surface protein
MLQKPSPFYKKTRRIEPKFVIKVSVTNGQTFSFPIAGTGVTVEWGDGTSSTGTYTTGVPLTKVYAVGGKYIIKVSTQITRVLYDTTANASKESVLEIMNWGSASWSSMEYAFYGCSNLNVTAKDAPNLASVTSVRGMFYACSKLGSAHSFARWNLSNVTNIRDMFRECSRFNGNITNWNVSNTTDARSVIRDCTRFNRPLLWNCNKWTTAVTFMDNSGVTGDSYNRTLNHFKFIAETLGVGAVIFGANTSVASGTGLTARTFLISVEGWTINDAS